jgi:hypothetical protein
MSSSSPDDNWLEIDSPPKPDDWLSIEDPNAGKTTREFESLLQSCMRGTNRVMACDGQFLAYRPFNHVFDKEVNPRTQQRFADFQAAGHFEHIGTFDEVQIYKLLDGSPFKQSKKNYVIGTNYWKDIRDAAKAACARDWSTYHDLLGAMAMAMKAGRDPNFARAIWGDTLNHIAVTIQQMRGPTEAEVNAGFVGVRRARGISKGGVIATLNTSGLQKVGVK